MGAIAHELVPIVMPDLTPEMAEQSAIKLAHVNISVVQYRVTDDDFLRVQAEEPESQEGETPGTLEFGAALGSVTFVLGLCNGCIGLSFDHLGAERAKKELVMKIFKLVLLSSLTFVFFGVLRAALFLYILFLPDSPLRRRTRRRRPHCAGSGDRANFAQAKRILLLRN